MLSSLTKLPSILDRTTPITQVLLVYHDADLDGLCAAAIVYQYCHAKDIPVKLVGADYDRRPDIAEDAQTRTVIMVDFSYPISMMVTIPDLIWIDHHTSAMQDAKHLDFNPPGVRIEKIAGCELTWCYFNPDRATSIPYSVHLLGRWDVWDHADPNCEPFQMGSRCFDNNVKSPRWDLLFNDEIHVIQSDIRAGRIVMEYLKQARKLTQRGVYVMNWPWPLAPMAIVSASPVTILALNTAGHSSKQFEGHPLYATADIFLCYHYTGKDWKISLYRGPHAPSELDCGAIAHQFPGGGGRSGAAGFNCAKLPWIE